MEENITEQLRSACPSAAQAAIAFTCRRVPLTSDRKFAHSLDLLQLRHAATGGKRGAHGGWMRAESDGGRKDGYVKKNASAVSVSSGELLRMHNHDSCVQPTDAITQRSQHSDTALATVDCQSRD